MRPARTRPLVPSPPWRRDAAFRPGTALLLGWLAHALLRMALAATRAMPAAAPDEYGYLFSARVLTGGVGTDLSHGTIYRAGYALLVAPVLYLTDDPDVAYHAMLGVNALVSALMLPLGYVLLRRFGLAPGPAFLCGNAVALLPAVLFFSLFALTDAILPVVTLGWLLLAHSWLSAAAPPRRIALYAGGASLLAAYAHVCHSRGLLLVLAQMGLLGAAVLLRRPWTAQAVGAAVLGGVLLAGGLLNARLTAVLYPFGDNRLQDNVRDRLLSLDGWGWTLGLATGQLWSQLVITGGVAGIGLLAFGRTALRRGTPGAQRALALAVLGIVAGIALATSAALPDERRVGNFAYARYLAPVLPVLFAAGLAVLLRARRRVTVTAGAAAALLVASAGVVQAFAGDRLSRYEHLAFDFPEISLLTWNWTQLRLWHATVAGLVLFAVAVLLARRGAGPLTGVFALVSLVIVGTALTRAAQPISGEFARVSDMRTLLPPGERPPVAMDRNLAWTIRLPLQYRMPWARPAGYDGRVGGPPPGAGLVIVAWDGRSAPTSTWRGGAPPGWRVAAALPAFDGGWVAWVPVR
ncbi:hypothetical protein [Actinomadura flavalba]|uniref:hypothetical protein n=1 Tax=Actinomadura flavalba TaxID=1120938 RepID=UPI0003671629|nr:hypothetical protein [Actinomadura flavalba]